jgi:hypothetical protein
MFTFMVCMHVNMHMHTNENIHACCTFTSSKVKITRQTVRTVVVMKTAILATKQVRLRLIAKQVALIMKPGLPIIN